jgi:probable rRNA maturation factor
MIHLDISDPFVDSVDPLLIEHAVQQALAHQQVPEDAEVTIVITDDSRLQALNREFLGQDLPTDVLSFKADYIDPETNRPYLGDVIISFPQAQAQATVGGHTVAAEIQLLAVHGVLHLLGHDHLEAAAKEQMWAAQTEILLQSGNLLTPP